MADAFSRDLVRGSLDLVVLSVLAEEAKYGYSIQKRVQEATGNQIRLQAGTLYPLLHRLEADKLIRARWDESTGRPRKWYEITAAGRRELNRQVHDWKRYVECISGMLVSVLRTNPEPA